MTPAAPLPTLHHRPWQSAFQAAWGDRLRMLESFAAGGEIGLAFIGRYAIVLVNAPDPIHEVLVTQADAFHKGKGLSVFARPLLGDGLLTSENDTHRRQRRLIAPAFSPKRIAGYADTMAHLTEAAQQAWANGARIDVGREMMRLTFAIVARTLFGADVSGGTDAFGDALKTTIHHAAQRSWTPLAAPAHWPTPGNRRAHRALDYMDTVVRDIIAARRAHSEDTGDLLSLLLLARDEDDGGTMRDTQVRDEAMTLLVAGHETTANALAWTFDLLARHSDIEARLHHELDTVLAGRTPTLDDLPRLPYTLQVFQEAMRLYPPAYAISREAMRDVCIGGYRIPKGKIVVICPYLMHRRPDLFPDPERFDPDRFAPGEEKTRPRYAFMPFGGGPRLCIGNHFALMEGQIVLATLAQRVRFRRASRRPARPEALITLRPKRGIPMIVTRRTRA